VRRRNWRRMTNMKVVARPMPVAQPSIFAPYSSYFSA